MQPLLAVRGLDAFYGQAQILFGLSLELGHGEVVALLGRNGAGKSTTMKALVGLLSSRRGEVTFDGHDISTMPSFRIVRHGLGYVPEERRIFTDLTVDENLEVGRRAAGEEPGWTPERLFEVFPNLAEMRRRPASQMSGGEQQMLSIARTLMGNPRAVLLDEPSEGLAPIIVDQMGEAVRRMKREGIAILLSEQNLRFASAVSDRAYVIERGEIKYEGTMRDLAANRDIHHAYLSV